MAEPEVTYCDDYEAITGKKIPETKVVTAPKTVKAETTEAEVK